jgi:hypothetical protein
MSDIGIVAFNYATWSGQYPEFAQSVTVTQATNYFNIATMYLDNSPCSTVWNAAPGGKRETILYMLTSHIAALLATVDGQAPSPLVGRISSAAQGSVNVQTDIGDLPFNAQWFAQTKYGFMAWQALAPYRTALYISPPNPNGYPGGIFGGGTNPFGGFLGWHR